jgi:hypothetical protein
VKTVKTTSTDAAYDITSFYEAWRLTIQRYGIYNPYTGRGAIKGLLPHGPHNVRDVLATHILKQTGSYEQASYAIQDTADMVAKHYGRFLPQDNTRTPVKDASAADQILDLVAHGHDEYLSSPERSAAVRSAPGHHLWASVLGIRSPMMPKRDPARLENQGIKGF